MQSAFCSGYTNIDWLHSEISYCACVRGQELRAVVTRISWHCFNEGFQKCRKHLLSLNDTADPTQRIFTDQAVAAIESCATSNSS